MQTLTPVVPCTSWSLPCSGCSTCLPMDELALAGFVHHLWSVTDRLSRETTLGPLRMLSRDLRSHIDQMLNCETAHLRSCSSGGIHGGILRRFQSMRRLIIVGAPAGLSTPKSQLRCLLEVRPMRAARHALELSHVVRLDLLLVRGLSGECVTAVAASFPQLRHLTITIEAPPPGRLATRAAIAAAPGVSPTFFPALALLGRLDTLIAPAPTLDADWVCVGRLSGLTRLDFGEHWNWTVSPSARLYSLRRLLHLRHLVLPLNMFLFTPPFGLVWAAQLVQLRELHHCPAPCRAGDLRALRALPHLWRLSLEGVDPGFDEAAWGDQGGDDWEATSTLLRDELPAVRELRVLRVVCTKTFHRLLRAWGFPSLELLDAQLSFYQQVHEVEEAVEELGGVVSLLPPTVQRIGVHLVSHQPSEEEDEEEGSGDLADHEDCEVWLDTIKRALQKGVTRVARRVLLIEFVETSD